MKTVSQLDAAGYFTGPTDADESPLEPGVYLIPAGAIEVDPPSVAPGYRARWIGEWVIESLPLPPPPPPPEPPSASQLAAQIDAEADAIIQAVIGNRAQEYVDAETGASAYRDAGYTGAVPPSVQVWATVEGQTAQWAADDILAQAAAWRSASLAIRQARLQAKKSVRDADPDAMATWAGFVAAIRTQLGVA